MNKDVSVIIPMLNEERNLNKLLYAIENQTYLPKEVIFVDAGSIDNGIQIIKKYNENHSEFKLKILEYKKSLPGAGRNYGIKNASYKWIAFLDCGIIPSRKWLQKLVNFSIKNKSTGVFGLCHFTADTSFTKAVCAVSYGFERSRVALPGSMFHIDVFNHVGLFNPSMRSYEDVVWMKNYSNYYKNKSICNSAVVYYSDFPQNLFQVFSKWFLFHYSTVKVFGNPIQLLFYLLFPIGCLFSYFLNKNIILLLLLLYFISRVIISPIIKSKKVNWWEYDLVSFFHSLYLSLFIDLSKIGSSYAGIFYYIFKGR